MPVTFPTLIIEVAFATLPGAAVPTWTDITPFVKGIQCDGAHRQFELDKFEAGTVSVLLDNSADPAGAAARFDPNNTASPYYPNVLPERRIRGRATWNAVTYDLFNGYVEDWPPTTDYPFEGAVLVSVVDGFEALNAAPLDGSPYEVEVRADNPAAWWRLSDADGNGLMTDSIAGYDGHFQASPTTGQESLVAGSSLASTRFEKASNQSGRIISTSGAPLTGYPYSIVGVMEPDAVDTAGNRWWFYLADLIASGGVDSAWIYGTDSGSTLTGKLAWSAASAGQTRLVHSSVGVSDGKKHHVAVVAASAASMLLYVDGVDVTVVDTAGSPVFPTAPLEYIVGNERFQAVGGGIGGLLAEVQLYNSALSAGRVAAHALAMRTAWAGDLSGARVTRILDAIGWPAGDRDIDAGQSTLQAQSFNGALEAVQSVAESELGVVFMKPDGKVKFRDRHALLKAPYTVSQATFSDQAAGVNYDEVKPDFGNKLIRNVARVSRAGGVVQRAENATSRGKFWPRAYTKSGLLLEKDSEARDQAQYVVNRYSDPPFRYRTLTLTPYGIESTMFPLMLGLAIGDRITITQQPPGFAAPQSRDMHVEGISHDIVELEWTTTLQLSPVDPTTYFVLGTSTLGGAHVLGY